MSTQQRPNSGVLFKNDKDGGNPNWPDYKGSINIEGKEWWLSAWVKDGKRGKFMSLSVKPKESIKESYQAQETQQEFGKPEEDDVPF